MMSASNAIRAAYNDTPHPFTPNVARYGYVRRLAYELSYSDDRSQYGVAIAEVKPGDVVVKRHDLSQAFGTITAAEAYITSLKSAPFSVIAGSAE